MSTLKTTTACVKRAEYILKQAERIRTREDHVAMWDNKVELFNQINDSLASGAFSGEALDELRHAKDILYRAERKAGEQSKKTYMKNHTDTKRES